MKEHMSSRGSRYNSMKLKQTIVLSDKLVFLTFTALLTEIVCMYQMKGTANLGVFDLLPMTTLFQGSLIENLLAWLIPLLASLICGKQFNTYYPVRNSIFTRVKRRSFVMKLAKSAAISSFAGILYYHLCCLFFCILIGKIADPSMPMGVSMYLNSSGALLQSFYESMPILYLLMYFLLSSMYGAVFGLIGFITSCLMRNRIAVFFSPYAVMMISSILLAVLPRGFGILIDYNAFCVLKPSVLTYLPIKMQMMIGFSAPIFWALLLFILIRIITGKDQIWE